MTQTPPKPLASRPFPPPPHNPDRDPAMTQTTPQMTQTRKKLRPPSKNVLHPLRYGLYASLVATDWRSQMTETIFERCSAFAIITIDRRGAIRQQAAATRADALAKAKELAALRISVTVEDAAGRVIFER